MDARTVLAGLVAALSALALAVPARAANLTYRVESPRAMSSIGSGWGALDGDQPKVVWNGSAPLAIWAEDTSRVLPSQPRLRRILAQQLTVDGAAVGSAQVISGGPDGTPDIRGAAFDVDAASSNVGTLVVARVGGEVWAQRVNSAGQRNGDALLVAAAESGQSVQTLDVAWVAPSNQWVVSWKSTGAVSELRTRAVGAGGTLGTTRVQATGTTVYQPSLADGGLLAWTDTSTSPATVRAQRLGPDSAPTGDPIVVGTGFAGATATVRGADGSWLVAWKARTSQYASEHELLARRVTASGVPQGTTQVVAADLEDSAAPDAAANATGFLLTWTAKSRGSHTLYYEVFGRALDAAGVPLDTGPAQLTEFEHPDSEVGSHSPSVAGNPNGARFTLVAWEYAPDDKAAASETWPGRGLYGRALELDTGPQTTITSTPVDGHRSSTGTVAFASAAGATFECSPPAWEPCTSPQTITGMASGERYGLAVRATLDGWRDATYALASWVTGDFTAPALSYTARPPRLTTSRRAVFRMATEWGATIACRLEGGAWFDCTSGLVALEGFALGDHVFEAVATDQHGNSTAPLRWTWTVFSIEQAARAATPAVVPAPVSAARPARRAEARAVERRLSAANRALARRQLAEYRRRAR